MAEVIVVIPTFDRAAVLPRAIDSVRVQKGVDWRLVIVDDGSQDNTPEVLQPYLQDSRIQCLSLPHGGVSKARNAGVASGQEPLITFLDSDDQWLPGKLAAQVQFLKETGLNICQTEEIWMRRGVRVNPPAYAVKQAGDIFVLSLKACMITPSSVLMTRRLFEDMGGFDPRFPACEDYALWLHVTSRFPVGLLPKAYLVRYGGNADQLSAKYPAMDRFRIEAIALLLSGAEIKTEYRSAALSVLEAKLNIYGKGCVKRGRSEEVAWCEAMRSRFFHSAGSL